MDKVITGVCQAPYSHEAMVDLMINNPNLNHAQLAAYFGRDPGFMAAVLASDAFQSVLEPKRHLVVDPTLAATLDERFRALAIRSATVLQRKLNSDEVADMTVLKALEVGAKALGMGLKPKEVESAPQLAGPEAVAQRIMKAMNAKRNSEAVDVQVREVPDGD